MLLVNPPAANRYRRYDINHHVYLLHVIFVADHSAEVGEAGWCLAGGLRKRSCHSSGLQAFSIGPLYPQAQPRL